MLNKIRKRNKEDWKRQINSADRKLYNRLRNVHRPGHQLRKKFSTILFIAASITAIIIPTMAVISITTQTESCLRGTTGLTCTVNSANTLTLLPAGQVNTLLLRDEHGLTLGTLSMRLTSLKMACHQQSIAWLRSYRIEPTAVKRCPRAGSCFNDHCENVRPNSYVKELQVGRELPGNTFCIPSTNILLDQQVQMSLKSSHAQVGARKWSSNSRWKPMVANDERNPSFYIPASHRHGETSPSHPWQSLFRLCHRLPVDLHCATEEAARSLNCSLDLEACKECFPNHNDGTVECNCRDVDLDAMMENPETRLPITRAKVWLENNGPSISATYVYAPIQIHLQMKSLALHLQLRDSKCFMDEARLHGCYRCGAGAQITYKCRSDNANVLATVKCEDGTLFVAHCSTNGTLGKELIPIDYADVDTICTVDCPAGETNFILNGSLYYIPLRRQWGHQQHRSKQLIVDPETFSFWPDFGFDLWVIGKLLQGGPIFLGIITSIGLALLAVYLFMRLSPIFRIYRQMARTITILVMLSQVQSANITTFDKSERISSAPISSKDTFGWNLFGIAVASTAKRNKIPIAYQHVQSTFQWQITIINNTPIFKIINIHLESTQSNSFNNTFLIVYVELRMSSRPLSPFENGGFGTPLRNRQMEPQFPRTPSPPRNRYASNQPLSNRQVSPTLLHSRQTGNRQRQEVTERLDEYLVSRFGNNWWKTVATIDRINRQLRGLMIRDHTNGNNILDWDCITYKPAQKLLVQPGETVAQHWQMKGRPIREPHLPVLRQFGGIRGTSRQSRQRQRLGFIPWKMGYDHNSYFPLQNLEIVIPTPLANHNQDRQEYRQPPQNYVITEATRQHIITKLVKTRDEINETIELVQQLSTSEQPSTSWKWSGGMP
uniref:Phlebovirus glycoprotein G2 fusion domain-containing protein n=1 Tax=Meloidogyne javanica TaxID=6303 RepID=A0A915LCH2_MELJA